MSIRRTADFIICFCCYRSCHTRICFTPTRRYTIWRVRTTSSPRTFGVDYITYASLALGKIIVLRATGQIWTNWCAVSAGWVLWLGNPIKTSSALSPIFLTQVIHSLIFWRQIIDIGTVFLNEIFDIGDVFRTGFKSFDNLIELFRLLIILLK